MIDTRIPALVAALAGALSGCASPPPIASGQLREVRDQPLPSFEVHEDCAAMVPGERLEYSFEAGAPLAFNIHYHEGKVVVMPVTRGAVQRDQGVFSPLTAQDYCLMWEAGPQGTLLNYRVRLIRAGPGPAPK